jgi:hypothetical protein
MPDEELQYLIQAQLELPALSNAAIVQCRKAMERVAREKLIALGLLGESNKLPNINDLETEHDMEQLRRQADEAFKKAADAYREAMPPLTGSENIRNFIACVGHGMLLHIFNENEASKLLYAAQVASGAEVKRYKSKFGII